MQYAVGECCESNALKKGRQKQCAGGIYAYELCFDWKVHSDLFYFFL